MSTELVEVELVTLADSSAPTKLAASTEPVEVGPVALAEPVEAKRS